MVGVGRPVAPSGAIGFSGGVDRRGRIAFRPRDGGEHVERVGLPQPIGAELRRLPDVGEAGLGFRRAAAPKLELGKGNQGRQLELDQVHGPRAGERMVQPLVRAGNITQAERRLALPERGMDEISFMPPDCC